jgi:hypothetical protein
MKQHNQTITKEMKIHSDEVGKEMFIQTADFA